MMHTDSSTSCPNPIAPEHLWPLLADESPLNDLDDAESDIDELLDDLADAVSEQADEPAPLADPGTP